MAGKISKETIAQLKADIRTVRPGKPAPFYYILENNEGDPVLLMGRAAPRAFKSTLKDLKQKRFAQGTVSREGKSLTFQFKKTPPSRFSKHLKTYFGAGVAALKSAAIAQGGANKAAEAEAEAAAETVSDLSTLTLAQLKALPNQKDRKVRDAIKHRKTIAKQGRQLTTNLKGSQSQRAQIEAEFSAITGDTEADVQKRSAMITQLEKLLAQLETERAQFQQVLAR